MRGRQKDEDWIKFYEEIARVTGVKIENAPANSYCLVTDGESKMFGRIGVYVGRGEGACLNLAYFKFKGKHRHVVLDTSVNYWAVNVELLFEKKSELEVLFQ